MSDAVSGEAVEQKMEAVVSEDVAAAEASGVVRSSKKDAAHKPEELELPLASIGRIIKAVLPDGLQVGRDAKFAVSKATGIFALYIGSTAGDIARNNGRSTISGDDVLTAIDECQLDEITGPAVAFLNAHRAEAKAKRQINMSDEQKATEEEKEKARALKAKKSKGKAKGKAAAKSGAKKKTKPASKKNKKAADAADDAGKPRASVDNDAPASKRQKLDDGSAAAMPSTEEVGAARAATADSAMVDDAVS